MGGTVVSLIRGLTTRPKNLRMRGKSGFPAFPYHDHRDFWHMFVFLILLSLFSFSEEPEGILTGNLPLGIEPDFEIPSDNPLTPEKVELGKRLFFDSRLSLDESLSCATCHDAEKGFSNGRAVTEGVSGQNGSRNVPTLVNRIYGGMQFWDGRAETLESQVAGSPL